MDYLNEILLEITLKDSPELRSDLKKLSRFAVESDEYKSLKRKLILKYHPDRRGGNTELAALLNDGIDRIEANKTDKRTTFDKIKEGFQDTAKAWKSDWKDMTAPKNRFGDLFHVNTKILNQAVYSLSNWLNQYNHNTKKLGSISLIHMLSAYQNKSISAEKLVHMLLSRERPLRVLLRKMAIHDEDIDIFFNRLHKANLETDETVNEEILNEMIPLALSAVIGLAALPASLLSIKLSNKLLQKVIISQNEKKGLYPVYEGKKITGFAPKVTTTAINTGSDIKSAIAKRASEGFVSIKENLSPLGEFLKKTPEFINDHIPQTIGVIGGAALIIALAKHLLKKRKLEKYPNIEKEAKKLNKKYKEPLDKKKDS